MRLSSAQHLSNYQPGGAARTRTYSVPNAGQSGVVAVRHRASLQCARQFNDTPSPTNYVRVRSFSTSSRGVKNRGDSFKRRPHGLLSLSLVENNSINGNSSSTRTKDMCAAASVAPPADELKVVVVGDVGVGKRSIISQFTTSEYMHGTADDYSPTASG